MAKNLTLGQIFACLVQRCPLPHFFACFTPTSSQKLCQDIILGNLKEN